MEIALRLAHVGLRRREVLAPEEILIVAMPKTKVVLTIETNLVERLDELIAQQRFRNRSQAVESALAEKMRQLERTRLARECAKLDPKHEKALAEEGFAGSVETWPEY